MSGAWRDLIWEQEAAGSNLVIPTDHRHVSEIFTMLVCPYSRWRTAPKKLCLTNTRPSTTPLLDAVGMRTEFVVAGGEGERACMMVAPAARAAATTSVVVASMLVFSMTSCTAPCSARFVRRRVSIRRRKLVQRSAQRLNFSR